MTDDAFDDVTDEQPELDFDAIGKTALNKALKLMQEVEANPANTTAPRYESAREDIRISISEEYRNIADSARAWTEYGPYGHREQEKEVPTEFTFNIKVEGVE